jgi:hypothetical protein
MDCRHENDIIDQHEGTIICTDCGTVKDLYYCEFNKQYIPKIENNTYGQIENLLEQLHLPEQFSSTIKNNLDPLFLKRNRNSKEKSHNINKVTNEIYNTINKDDTIILLKDLINFSKVPSNKIKSKDISIVNIHTVLEKYTKKFNINFKNNTVIKEEVLKYTNTGFQPLTIIGGIIYKHFATINEKKSMKQIASILGISAISIQRFLKYQYEISSRT